MFMKYLKSNKGSTLVLVLITLSVLSILGTAIIGLSVINYKMKIVDKNVKTSFYLAEAGLEEAYAAIGNAIDDGVKAGNKKIVLEIDSFIAKERRKEAKDPEKDESRYINGSDGFGSVNERKLKIKIEQWFREGYAECLNNGFHFVEDGKNDDFKSIEGWIKNGESYSVVDPNVDEKKPRISINNISKKFPENKDDLDKGDEYVITLQSEFLHNNITKIVRGTFAIKIPAYNKPYYVKNVMTKINENVLWSKPITTEKNMYVLGNDVTIKGNIYAYGKEENGIKGGIIVGNNGKSGELKANGNIATNEFIYTNEDNSVISINKFSSEDDAEGHVKGDVYCNSLVIPENTTGCTINVYDRAVNTYDDIELNGINANIYIDGPYFGFSDGSTALEHDESSSIVINSDDIGSGSALTITGKETDKNNPLNANVGSYISDNNGVFIAGTVYVNLDNPSKKYQTGESVSVKGNYKAYSEYLDDKEGRDGRFDPDNVVMGSFPPLVLISKYKEGTTDKEYNVVDKSNYINFYNNDKPNSLRLGGDSGILINNVRYSAGAYISNKALENIKGTPDFWSHYSYKKEEDYQYFVNKMSDFLNYTNFYDTDLDEVVSINDRVTFDTDINSSIENNQIIRVNTDPSKAIFIKGIDGTEISGLPSDIRLSSYETINLSNKDVNGVIVTKGDVIITGSINYTGIIVAEGNVYLYDDKRKVIENEYGSNIDDRAYIINVMNENDSLREMFKNGMDRSFLVEVKAGESDVETYLKFEDLVGIKWEKVR